MPTVFTDGGFAVRVYLNDHDPPHVHLWKGGGRISVSPPSPRVPAKVMGTVGIKRAEMVRAVRLVEQHAEVLWDAWRRYHGEEADGR